MSKLKNVTDIQVAKENVSNVIGEIPIDEMPISQNNTVFEQKIEDQMLSEKIPLEQEVDEKGNSSFAWYFLGGLAALGGSALLFRSKGDKGGEQVAEHQKNEQEGEKQNSSTVSQHTVLPSTSLKPQSSVETEEERNEQQSQNHVEKIETEKSELQQDNEMKLEESTSVTSYQYDFETFKLNSQRDNDNDGLLDILDPNPQRWNISERDLRAFSTLSYQDEKELNAIFNDKNLTEWNKINQNKEKGFNQSFSEKESQDFIETWDFVNSEHKGDFLGSGLDYAIFGQGKKANGGYEQLVFAFRGSKGSLTNFQDWYADLKALRGDTPTQAKQLEEDKVIQELLEKSDAVYVTGHSLGGYLSQYFTAYIMQQSPELQAKMKHSAIFNPLMLLTDSKSPEALKLARHYNDHLVKEKIHNDDVMSDVPLYKTNSYVINGEFLADGGVPKEMITKATVGGGALGSLALGLLTGGIGFLAGAAVGGLAGSSLAKEVIGKTGYGTYDNVVRFEPEQRDWLDSHSLVRFYEKTDKLVEYFSFGSRHDNWEQGENTYAQDSDNDGIADAVERYFHSDPHDANSGIAYVSLNESRKNSSDVLPVVVYRLGEQSDFSSDSTAQVEHILGNNMDNRLDGGTGNNILSGGNGRDVFVLGKNDFKNQELNTIVDFDSTEDKLDLSILGLSKTDLSSVFSNDANIDALLYWNTENQTLNYQVDDQSFVLAHFLNQTEVSVENIVV